MIRVRDVSGLRERAATPKTTRNFGSTIYCPPVVACDAAHRITQAKTRVRGGGLAAVRARARTSSSGVMDASTSTDVIPFRASAAEYAATSAGSARGGHK